VPYAVGAKKLLAVLTPVYQSGVVPVDLQQRRKAFLGWIGIVLSPNVVLSQALDGHANTAVVFRYEGKGSDATFSLGHAPKNAHSTTIDLQDGWTVRTFAATTGSSVFEYRNLLALTIFGIIMSALLAGLVFVLGTQRARALRTVTKQTGELRYQALHDALTGLPNRVLITDRIEQLLVRSRRAGTMGAALFFDLDGFKNVNDTFGHKTGDQLLQAVTARLTASLRGADTIGRLGGDEFVVLVEGGDPSESGPQRVADKLLHLIRQPFELESIAAPLTVTASVGIAIGDRDSASDLLRDADLALYQAKARGKDCYALFCADMESHARQRYALESDLRSALQNNQYRLAYQPVYNLDDLSLAGAEALLRWDHPDLGVLEPDEFIPLLESSGQILDVGKWVLIEACRQMVDWQDGCAPGLGVSVNVSARQFDSDLLVEHVRTALELSGLPPADLTIEITETDVMRDPQSTVQRLRELKALGVRLALDDFGTGYSSLAYLQHFPVDSIKIDKMFVDAMTQSPQAEALVRTLVQLGTDLGLTTLAEGVETLAQMDHLRGQHVNQAQGFLLAQPMEPGTFEEELLVHTRLPVPGLPKPRAGHDESATHIP
jgi:diguanylate cyclase (GGDEF)-like protein